MLSSTVFQPTPVDLAAEFQALRLTSPADQGQSWQPAAAVPGSAPSGKDAGSALLKLLQSGGGHAGQAHLGQQQPQAAQQQEAMPALSLSFLSGAALPQPARADHLVPGLFAAAPAAGASPASDPMPHQVLPSLFAGNSIWSTSSSDGVGPGSLWGGSSIWSSQQEGWAPRPAEQQQAPHHAGPFAPGGPQPAVPSRASPAPLLSPRHHQPPPQSQHHHAHPHPPYQQHHGYAPAMEHAAAHRPPPPQPYQQHHGGFPPQHAPPAPPAFLPPPGHQQYQQQQSTGLGFGGDRQPHAPYHPQPPLPPYSGGGPGFPADFALGSGGGGGQPGGFPGAGPLHIPPPPGPQPAGHAPKFAPPSQQHQGQVQGQLGVALAEERLTPPLPQAHGNVQQATDGVGSRAGGQYMQGPKMMRHQQLKAAGGMANNYSPKHSNRESRWVEVGDRGHSGRLPRGDLAQLDARLLTLVESLMPTPDEQQRQRTAFEHVREVLLRRWPHARVHLFGSVANGLSVRSNNDLDVCLEMEDVADDQAAKGEVATELGEVLREAGMSEVLPLPKARVPVVKFVVPDTGTKVDVTVNNILACINTKLLADYAAIDPRLSQLVAVVKHWAKQRAVNDSYRGTLSSYCYVLMCIHLLQTRSPPVLPSLQQMPPTFRRHVGQWECCFFDQVDSLRDFGADNGESLAQLVWSFFEYWAWRHDYSTDVVSVRTGGFLRKEDKDWTRRIGNERHLVCIEDPFELSHDLGRTVDRQTKSVLHKEFIRAATLLRDAPDPLDKLFEPYRVARG